MDADLLLWECSYAGQYKDEETGELVMSDFENVKDVFEQRIKEMEEACWATEPSVLYFTADERLVKSVNRERKRNGEEPLEFKPNFRFSVAVSTEYKQRKGVRPLHYYNLRAYCLHTRPCVVSVGMEADDRLAIDQDVEGLSTVICSRDKDLLGVEGLHYTWECGNQPSWGPCLIDKIGTISLPKPTKLVGTGLRFFCSQMITGDSVDSIPGLPRGGPVLAYNTLKDCETEEELLFAVKSLYVNKFGDAWKENMLEQGRLLWMVRELDEDGQPIMWEIPSYLEDEYDNTKQA